jgi:hypothetical protein
MKRKLAALALVAVPCILVPLTTHAGVQYTDGATCYNATSTSNGECYGTVAAFRTDPYFDSFASFYTEVANGGQSYPWIEVNTANGGGGCVPPTWMMSTLAAAVNHRGYFSVTFDQNGNCTSLQIGEASYYAE